MRYCKVMFNDIANSEPTVRRKKETYPEYNATESKKGKQPLNNEKLKISFLKMVGRHKKRQFVFN